MLQIFSSQPQPVWQGPNTLRD